MFKKLFGKKPKDTVQSLLDDPISLEMIAKIARDCGRYFEIIRPSDGLTLRFYKDGEQPRPQNGDVW